MCWGGAWGGGPRGRGCWCDGMDIGMDCVADGGGIPVSDCRLGSKFGGGSPRDGIWP